MNSGNRNVLLTRCSTPMRPIPQGPILNSPSRACGFKRQMFWRVEAGISSVSVASDAMIAPNAKKTAIPITPAGGRFIPVAADIQHPVPSASTSAW